MKNGEKSARTGAFFFRGKAAPNTAPLCKGSWRLGRQGDWLPKTACTRGFPAEGKRLCPWEKGSARGRGRGIRATGAGRGNPPSRRGTVGPTISFLEKEMVPPGGTREKSPGVTMPSAPPEAQKHPRHSHHNRGISAEMQCGTAPRATRDFTGEPCSPVNPFFLDGEHPHPADRGSRGTIEPSGGALIFNPPGAFSLGPLQRPVLFSAAKPPRPIWAAPRVRRPTQGAPVWGDRSLSN